MNMSKSVFISKDMSTLEKNLFKSDKEIKIDIRDSQREAEMFHFKVMSLKVHEDTN